MHGDHTKVRQVLLNLASNACKFTESGVVTIEVEPEEADAGGSVVFRVRDTGIGMTADQVEQCFQPFTQGDASTTRRHGGTGLGLAITKRFCEVMGGSIDVRTEPDRGTTFEVRLPRASEHVAEAGRNEDATCGNGQAEPRDVGSVNLLNRGAPVSATAAAAASVPG